MNKKTLKNKIKKTATKVSEGSKAAATKSKEIISSSQKSVINMIDQDGNGKTDVTDIIIMAMKVPGIRVDREVFLRKEFFKNHPSEVVDEIIKSNPAKAGISKDEVEKIVDEVIKYERNAVSGISTALGMPGGVAVAATIPADIAQYYGYMLRAAQKMLYLYGFPEIMSDDVNVELDTETINSLTLCLAVMYGVAGANNAVKAMSKALAVGVEKKLINASLTKGIIYPVVKSTAKFFGMKITKEIFAGAVGKSIPVVGGIVGGGITYVSFKPCCLKLKDALSDTKLSNPDNHRESNEEEKLFSDIINGVVYDIEDNDLISE